MFAAIENNLPLMERLVALGCSVNKKNKEGYIALHFGNTILTLTLSISSSVPAVMYSRDDTVSWLLARKAAPALTAGPSQQTCLHLASARHSGQSLQIVKVLLLHSPADLRLKGKLPASVHHVNSHEVHLSEDACGSIPLFCAIEAGNNNVCRELLGSLAEQQVLHVKQPLGDTAMHLAARRRDANLMKTLIEAGAQVVILNFHLSHIYFQCFSI